MKNEMWEALNSGNKENKLLVYGCTEKEDSFIKWTNQGRKEELNSKGEDRT